MDIDFFTRLKKIIISPLFVGIVFFLFIQLQVFNLSIDFRDEGLLLSNAVKINNGQIPYRDFPLVTTPGTYYIQAFVMRIFGNYIISDRIIYVLCSILILILGSKLFRFSFYFNYLFLILLGIVYFGKGAYGFYNIEGLVLILSSFLLFKKLVRKNNAFLYSFLIGASNSLVFIVKQSYGSMAFATFFLLLIVFTEKKWFTRNIIAYFGGIFTILIPFFSYFYLNKAFNDLVYYIFYFSGLVKSHRLPFVITSLLFIPFFIFTYNVFRKLSFKRIVFAIFSVLCFLILYFLISPRRINYLLPTFTDISTYYFLLFLIVPLIAMSIFIKKRKIHEKQILIISLISLCMFLVSASSGRDYAAVVVVSPFYIPLFIFILEKKFKNFSKLTRNIIVTIILFLFIFPSVVYLLKTSVSLYSNKIIYGKISGEQNKYIMIPLSQSEDLNKIISYVNRPSLPSSKLLCFPYCPMLNYLSNWESASYFSFFYPETFGMENQQRAIGDLEKTDKEIVLMQRPGLIEKEAGFEDKRLNLLKKYINDNYEITKTYENFYIYEEK